ncbi:heat-inducible transcriptional repressor HrcA [Hippea maritima]|uniref:Heat-inducible transcription repressor HrcA n=1 Tax=Hippea maritima (strain ATCC 700847 / DSM 10411 / MH2) TaxID=760142 RepID=F2LUC9_HIPMA|nr:heat-inducible transcriptional repressor HrcA [Hippea maritima]AEA33455.1 heat-inducible transcription repressor HrcA [Hippea maritima DSM 10411]
MSRLDERKVLVLSIIVDNYIKHKQAAGSRVLTKRYNLNFSPATMRNVMLDLEEMGYLTHTHTSGGKIPTPKGIKFYIDMIMQNFSPKLKSEFERIPLNDTFGSLDDKMNKILDTMSSLSEVVSVLTMPDFSKTKIKNIQFIRIGDGKILCVLVSDSNIMETKVVSVEKTPTDTELKEFSEFISEKYKGYSLEEIADELRGYLEGERRQCETLIYNLKKEAQKPKVMVDGIENIFKYPEFQRDLEKLKKLVKTLEDRKTLLELIRSAIKSERFILIGDELPLPGLDELGFVSSAYKYLDKNIGVVGVVGPINMDYTEMMNIIESAKKKINDILNIGG